MRIYLHIITALHVAVLTNWWGYPKLSAIAAIYAGFFLAKGGYLLWQRRKLSRAARLNG